MRRALVTLGLLAALCGVAGADPKTVTLGGVKPLQTRAEVESHVGPPMLSDPVNHVYQYPKSLTVLYDPYDRVISVHGVELDINGKPSDAATRAELEKALGQTDRGSDDKDRKYSGPLVFGRYGLTAYFKDDQVTGYLLEPVMPSGSPPPPLPASPPPP